MKSIWSRPLFWLLVFCWLSLAFLSLRNITPSLPPSSHAFPLCVYLSLCPNFLFIRTPVVLARDHPNNPRFLVFNYYWIYWGWLWWRKLYGFQMYNSIIHHLCALHCPFTTQSQVFSQLIISAMTYPQIRSLAEVLGIEDSTYELWRESIQPICHLATLIP